MRFCRKDATPPSTWYAWYPVSAYDAYTHRFLVVWRETVKRRRSMRGFWWYETID